MKRTVAAAVGLFGVGPALACSGYSARYHQNNADVVVAGRLIQGAEPARQIVTPQRILKGQKQNAYRIVWPFPLADDECAFLYPVEIDRGVYFLKRRDDGRYDVLWAARRWKMVR